ncbi:acylphosphatase [Evansella cellulosilytica]|uniref:Acylphosphatase n=1 Tax=Evansella cellulosilytica (strain ATCC 21833 / DSM 2522 / FERM P-1141 / JCM 9156 / N-4) TaxID=649639 RepID=E6TWB2_EVAC2|nr:acylphosphatase [Evansella cellulosilytica]ADU31068.1 acylphosphatase [Evansella cellulosilytica DSM 2522]
MKRAFIIIVKGKVQGVGFRRYTKKKAMQFNVLGWVKNNKDGSVEIHVEGGEDGVNSFINKLRVGPKSSEIKSVYIEEKSKLEGFKSFRIKKGNN